MLTTKINFLLLLLSFTALSLLLPKSPTPSMLLRWRKQISNWENAAFAANEQPRQKPPLSSLLSTLMLKRPNKHLDPLLPLINLFFFKLYKNQKTNQNKKIKLTLKGSITQSDTDSLLVLNILFQHSVHWVCVSACQGREQHEFMSCRGEEQKKRTPLHKSRNNHSRILLQTWEDDKDEKDEALSTL